MRRKPKILDKKVLISRNNTVWQCRRLPEETWYLGSCQIIVLRLTYTSIISIDRIKQKMPVIYSRGYKQDHSFEETQTNRCDASYAKSPALAFYIKENATRIS